MFDKIKLYQTRFWLEENTIKTIRESSSSFLLELFSKVDDLTDLDLVYYDNAMDMETCFEKYSFSEFKWNKTPNDDMEWIFMLNRQGFLVDLAMAYYLTHELKYFEKWKEIIFDFISINEGEEYAHQESSWRILDAGIRLMNWIKSLTYLPLDNLNEIEKKHIYNSMKKHVEYIQSRFLEKHILSNWGVLAVSGILSFLYLDDEESASFKWAKEILFKQANIQFTKKGIHWEQSPLYHHQVTMCYAYLYQLTSYLENEDVKIWKDILIKPIHAAHYLSNDNQYLLALNDSDTVDFSWVYSYYNLLGFDSCCTNYEIGILFSGKKFLELHKVYFDEFFFDNVAGLAVIKREDIYFSFFGGLHGSSHGHSSQGAFSLEINGIEIMTFAGRYTYKECELRNILKSEMMQNSVQIEGGNYPSIKSSWSYNWVPKILSMTALKEDSLYCFECQWEVPINTSSDIDKRIIIRKIIIDSNKKVMVIIDETQKEDLIYQTFIVPTIKKLDFNFWTNGKMDIDPISYSRRYNMLEEGMRLKIKNSITPLVTCISLETYYIEQEEIRRQEFNEEVQGIKIQCTKGNEELVVYYSPEDISNGLKYIKDTDGKILYGKLIVRKDGKTFRLM